MSGEWLLSRVPPAATCFSIGLLDMEAQLVVEFVLDGGVGTARAGGTARPPACHALELVGYLASDPWIYGVSSRSPTAAVSERHAASCSPSAVRPARVSS